MYMRYVIIQYIYIYIYTHIYVYVYIYIYISNKETHIYIYIRIADGLPKGCKVSYEPIAGDARQPTPGTCARR